MRIELKMGMKRQQPIGTFSFKKINLLILTYEKIA